MNSLLTIGHLPILKRNLDSSRCEQCARMLDLRFGNLGIEDVRNVVGFHNISIGKRHNLACEIVW